MLFTRVDYGRVELKGMSEVALKPSFQCEVHQIFRGEQPPGLGTTSSVRKPNPETRFTEATRGSDTRAQNFRRCHSDEVGLGNVVKHPEHRVRGLAFTTIQRDWNGHP